MHGQKNMIRSHVQHKPHVAHKNYIPYLQIRAAQLINFLIAITIMDAIIM